MPNQMTLKYLTSNKMFLNINQCGYWSENCKFSSITPWREWDTMTVVSRASGLARCLSIF